MSKRTVAHDNPGSPASNAPPASAEGAPPWVRYVAMLTGVLAALGGFLTVRGGRLADDAIYHSTHAVLYQARASDSWSEYQADSVKARIVETQIASGAAGAPAKPELEAAARELRDRQPDLAKKAKDFEQQRETELSISGRRLNEKGNLDLAGTFVQLGIALASVAAMTRRKAAFVAGIIAAAVGAGMTGYVLLGHFLTKG